MTKHVKRLKLTAFMKRRLETLHHIMKCDRCGNPLQAGEVMVSKRGVNGSQVKHYHGKCWDSMFME